MRHQVISTQQALCCWSTSCPASAPGSEWALPVPAKAHPHELTICLKHIFRVRDVHVDMYSCSRNNPADMQRQGAGPHCMMLHGPSGWDYGDNSPSSCGFAAISGCQCGTTTRRRDFSHLSSTTPQRHWLFYPDLSDSLLLQLSEDFEMPLCPQWLQSESTGKRREKLQAAECAGMSGYRSILRHNWSFNNIAPPWSSHTAAWGGTCSGWFFEPVKSPPKTCQVLNVTQMRWNQIAPWKSRYFAVLASLQLMICWHQWEFLAGICFCWGEHSDVLLVATVLSREPHWWGHLS